MHQLTHIHSEEGDDFLRQQGPAIICSDVDVFSYGVATVDVHGQAPGQLTRSCESETSDNNKTTKVRKLCGLHVAGNCDLIF